MPEVVDIEPRISERSSKKIADEHHDVGPPIWSTVHIGHS